MGLLSTSPLSCKDKALKEYWQILDEYWGEPGSSDSDAGAGPPPAAPPAPADGPAPDGPGSPGIAEEAASSSASAPEASQPSSSDFWTDSQPIEEYQPFDESQVEDSQPVEDDSQPVEDDYQPLQESKGVELVEESQQLADFVNPYAFEDASDEGASDEGEEAVTFGGDQGKVEVPPPSAEVDKSPALIVQKSPVFSNPSLTDVSGRKQHMVAKLEAIKWWV